MTSTEIALNNFLPDRHYKVVERFRLFFPYNSLHHNRTWTYFCTCFRFSDKCWCLQFIKM